MKHELLTCPRCHKLFECKVGNVAHCQCNIVLHPETTHFLRKTLYGCLCVDCLNQLNELIVLAKNHSFPKSPEELKEGLHFYRENGFWVFTEWYHILRGYCCQSGCRHCAYGFKKQRSV